MSSTEDKLIGLDRVWYLYQQPDLLRVFKRPQNNIDPSENWALRDVSLELRRGEFLGLIGNNGSGKSTLLKILSGVAFPTRGESLINAKLVSLLELGAAFDLEATGRENMLFSCFLQGVSSKKSASIVEEMIDFADIGDAIDQPMNSYSSGMYARVAFSSKVFFDVDLIILDEILAVGDNAFVHKSLRKLQEMRESGTSFIFVSHDMTAIKTLSSRVVWLHNGAKILEGEPSKIVDEYLIFAHEKVTDNAPQEKPSRNNTEMLPELSNKKIEISGNMSGRRGSQAAQFKNLKISGKGESDGVCLIEQGQNVLVEGLIYNHSVDFGSDLLVGVTLRNNRGVDLASANTNTFDIQLPAPPKKASVEMTIELSFPLLHPGQYSLSLNLAEEIDSGGYHNLDTLPDVQIIEIYGPVKVYCYWSLDCSFTFK
jgi:lipopolysaccharide transport system ATP-binding protein